MIRKAVLLALVGLCIAVRLSAQELDRLRKDLGDTELALEKERWTVPNCERPDDFAERVPKAAKASGLAGVTVKPGETGDGPPPFRVIRFDIAGSGSFYDVSFLLHRLAFLRISRILDFEALQMKAKPDGKVAFDARVALVCWDSGAKLLNELNPPSPAGRTVQDIELSMYRSRLQQLRTARENLALLERTWQPLRITDAIEDLEASWNEHAVRLTDVQWSRGALTLHGVALGAASRRAIDRALRANGFSAASLSFAAPSGVCRAFTAATTPPTAIPDVEKPRDEHPHDLFDARGEALCPRASKTAPTRRIAAHGTGKLTLRLHDVDVTSFFFALHNLAETDGYVVDADVDGRVDVDLDSVTIDEAIAAVRASGIANVTPGPLHHVCKTECPDAKSTKTYSGEPISIMVNDAAITDVLQAMKAEPHDAKGTISIYTHDTPLDHIVDALLAAPHRTAPRAAFPRIDAAHIAIEDLELTGVARDGDSATTYGRLPGQKILIALAPGLELYDGRIEAADATKVSVRMADGRVVALK